MKKILFIAIIAFGAWQWHTRTPPGFTGEAHDRVIMYSLTTCGFCDQKRNELMTARIRFAEYFIDKDPERRDELTQKLQKAGIPPQRVGTPTFDVHGTMLINNPPMVKIREHMNLVKKKS